MGRAAVLLEALIRRDGRSVDEAMPLVTNIDRSLTRADVEAMASRLRERTARPRIVAIDEEAERSVASSETAEATLLAYQSRELAAVAAEAIRTALASFTVEERMIIRFRFGTSMTPPKIAAALRLSLRTFYRRLDELILRLRRALIDAGVDGAAVDSIVDGALDDLDFGLVWQETQNCPSSPVSAAIEEIS